MFPKSNLLALTFLLVLLIPCQAYAVDSCKDCHQSLQDAYQKKVYSVWESSVHKNVPEGCRSCHGGDNATQDKNAAHKDMKQLTGKHITDLCGDCHVAEKKEFQKSFHFQKTADDAKTPTCVTCHSPKSGFIVSLNEFDSLCQSCHNERGEKAATTILKAKELYAFYLDSLKNQLKLSNEALSEAKRKGVKVELAEGMQELAERYATNARSFWHAFNLKEFEIEIRKAYYLSQEAESLVKKRE